VFATPVDDTLTNIAAIHDTMPGVTIDIVKPGDTLSSLAATAGESLAQIEADNPQVLKNSGSYDIIYGGEYVYIGRHRAITDPPPAPVTTTDVQAQSQNPVRDIANLSVERIDEGQDYSGNGPLYAIGDGVIVSTDGSGWPGGTFILERVLNGPGAGKFIYFAEDITPSVVPGQHVDSSTVIGTLNGQMEMGWATGLPQQTLAIATTGYVDGEQTPAGIDFAQFLQSLGAPSGTGGPTDGAGPLSEPTQAEYDSYYYHHHSHPAPAITAGTYSQNLLTLAQFLVAHGYSKAAAAGIASCVDGESGGNPESVGSGGGGLIGWTPLPGGFVTNQPTADLNTQLQAILNYNNANGHVAELNSISDPVAAADYYSQEFERPAVTNSDVVPSVAESVFAALGG
jgi:hypothetical protein